MTPPPCKVCGAPTSRDKYRRWRKTCSRTCALSRSTHLVSPETRAKIGAASHQTWSDPQYKTRHLARLSAALMGHPTSAATRAKIGAANAIAHKGKTRSPEHRAAISRGMVKRWSDPALRAAMAEKHRGNRYVRDAPVKGECAYCGRPAIGRDHVIPRDIPYGGSNHPSNLVLACAACNASKGVRDPWAWLADGLYGPRPGSRRRLAP